MERACSRQGAPGGAPGGPQGPREHPPRAEPQRGGSPDPIPNSAVKPLFAESTAAPGRGRIGRSARGGCFFSIHSPRRPARGGGAVLCRGGARAPAGGFSALGGAPPGEALPALYGDDLPPAPAGGFSALGGAPPAEGAPWGFLFVRIIFSGIFALERRWESDGQAGSNPQ